MRERPILFSGPMVRALLDGRKTQTRRVVKLDVPVDADEVFFWSGEELRRKGWRNVSEPGLWARKNGRDGYIEFIGRCPYGVPGDRLWVKESGLHKRGPLFELFIHDATPDRYWASPDHGGEKLTPEARGKRGAGIGPALTRDQHKGMGFKARPSIHMPRWASRLTLEVTDVRVERLQDISEADAEAEGVREPSLPPIHMVSAEACGQIDREKADAAFLWRFLWAGINGADSWDANPWVWAVSFRVLERDA